ncbi:Oidioi.mRNA.OKI2018_I69.PAR.g10507.t1.cds [Oikopleura dioica]|uniref:Oidioi.mRNA.OKI2018_I69.PAR.g10507.t1.cds n=1 Tax=Oikopleura dioica TaxID=34765 RepID=A0ABN7RQW4_OIKDI|nr:Oidioi.mRNA.OKI2018_I69.PAR.g10507.t1.cds [Oikopleura dioica]
MIFKNIIDDILEIHHWNCTNNPFEEVNVETCQKCYDKPTYYQPSSHVGSPWACFATHQELLVFFWIIVLDIILISLKIVVDCLKNFKERNDYSYEYEEEDVCTIDSENEKFLAKISTAGELSNILLVILGMVALKINSQETLDAFVILAIIDVVFFVGCPFLSFLWIRSFEEICDSEGLSNFVDFAISFSLSLTMIMISFNYAFPH